MMNRHAMLRTVLHDPKVAASVAGTSVTSPVWANMIPDVLTTAASMLGIVLTVILIWVNVTALRKTILELKIMRSKERARRAEIARRKKESLPIRRGEDYD